MLCDRSITRAVESVAEGEGTLDWMLKVQKFPGAAGLAGRVCCYLLGRANLGTRGEESKMVYVGETGCR